MLEFKHDAAVSVDNTTHRLTQWNNKDVKRKKKCNNQWTHARTPLLTSCQWHITEGGLEGNTQRPVWVSSRGRDFWRERFQFQTQSLTLNYKADRNGGGGGGGHHFEQKLSSAVLLLLQRNEVAVASSSKPVFKSQVAVSAPLDDGPGRQQKGRQPRRWVDPLATLSSFVVLWKN